MINFESHVVCTSVQYVLLVIIASRDFMIVKKTQLRICASFSQLLH